MNEPAGPLWGNNMNDDSEISKKEMFFVALGFASVLSSTANYLQEQKEFLSVENSPAISDTFQDYRTNPDLSDYPAIKVAPEGNPDSLPPISILSNDDLLAFIQQETEEKAREKAEEWEKGLESLSDPDEGKIPPDDTEDPLPEELNGPGLGENVPDEGNIPLDDTEDIQPEKLGGVGGGDTPDEQVDGRRNLDNGDQEQESGFWEKAIQCTKLGILAGGLYQGITVADGPPPYTYLQDNNQPEVVLSVKADDSRESFLDRLDANFQRGLGMSLYEAAGEIADDEKKRWEDKVRKEQNEMNRALEPDYAEERRLDEREIDVDVFADSDKTGKLL